MLLNAKKNKATATKMAPEASYLVGQRLLGKLYAVCANHPVEHR